MRKSNWLANGLAVLTIGLCICPVSAQKLTATVLYRQNSDDAYLAVVPGYSHNTVDCAADIANEACSGSAGSAKASTDPRDPSLSVVGTTLSLRLPDGRVAVVNCINKYSYKGNYLNRRSCAMPLVEQVEAEINGQSAKLKWLVGSDVKKTESENYKIVALLDKR